MLLSKLQKVKMVPRQVAMILRTLVWGHILILWATTRIACLDQAASHETGIAGVEHATVQYLLDEKIKKQK